MVWMVSVWHPKGDERLHEISTLPVVDGGLANSFACSEPAQTLNGGLTESPDGSHQIANNNHHQSLPMLATIDPPESAGSEP